MYVCVYNFTVYVIDFHYLLPSGFTSNLNVPYLQLSSIAEHSICTAANLALALVSTFVVVELTVNGPKGLEAAVDPCGKEFKNIVTCALH